MMRHHFIVGLLVTVSFAAPGYAQGLKIDPFPKDSPTSASPVVESQRNDEASAVDTADYGSFTARALQQMQEGRMMPDQSVLSDPEPVPDAGHIVMDVGGSPSVSQQSGVSEMGVPLSGAEGASRQGRLELDPVVEPEFIYQPEDVPVSSAQAITASSSPMGEPMIEDMGYTDDASLLPPPQSMRAELSPSTKVITSAQPQGYVSRAVGSNSDAVAGEASSSAVSQRPVSKRRYSGEPVMLGDTAIVVLEDQGDYNNYNASQPMQQSEPDAWIAMQNESLRSVLSGWATSEGVSLIWDAPEDFATPSRFEHDGSFEEAVMDLLAQYQSEGFRPVGQLYVDPVTKVRILTIKAGRS